MTKEELEEIVEAKLAEYKPYFINAAIEAALLKLPEVVGHLLEEKSRMRHLAKEFFESHKEFKEHKQVVASVIEELETDNPGEQYSKILEKSIPIINDRIGKLALVDNTKADRPSDLSYKDSINGEL